MDSSLTLLTETGHYKCKVSSTLNKSSEYASKHMFDGTDITCWNSDQGSPQFVVLDFTRRVIPRKVLIQFQGGFTCDNCTIELGLEFPHLDKTLKRFHNT